MAPDAGDNGIFSATYSNVRSIVVPSQYKDRPLIDMLNSGSGVRV